MKIERVPGLTAYDLCGARVGADRLLCTAARQPV